MRIAIACCGLEHVHRGYESFSRELFDALSIQADVILFKGSGKRSSREIVVPCLRRDFLVRFLNPGRAFYYEQLSFAIMLLPYLLIKRVDVLHYSEGNLGNALARFVRWTGLKVTLVQSNGGPQHPNHFRPEVFIHQVCKRGIDEAMEWGIPANRMSVVPYGINSKTFAQPADRSQTRMRFGLPSEKFIVLSLAAFNKSHKRQDYLIDEIAALRSTSVFLCMAGERTDDTPELEQIARELLPDRHCFLTVPRKLIPELLSCGDVFVHTALQEGFGMVLLEAMSAGLPIVCHNSDHFKWVLGEAAVFVDMSVPGALAQTVQNVIDEPNLRDRLGCLGQSRIGSQFEWSVLSPRYFAMYDAALKQNGKDS